MAGASVWVFCGFRAMRGKAVDRDNEPQSNVVGQCKGGGMEGGRTG